MLFRFKCSLEFEEYKKLRTECGGGGFNHTTIDFQEKRNKMWDGNLKQCERPKGNREEK